jgi:hypothetical protein
MDCAYIGKTDELGERRAYFVVSVEGISFEFYGALQEDDSRPTLTYEIGETLMLLGNNEGANLAGWAFWLLTTSLVANAAPLWWLVNPGDSVEISFHWLHTRRRLWIIQKLAIPALN